MVRWACRLSLPEGCAAFGQPVHLRWATIEILFRLQEINGDERYRCGSRHAWLHWDIQHSLKTSLPKFRSSVPVVLSIRSARPDNHVVNAQPSIVNAVNNSSSKTVRKWLLISRTLRKLILRPIRRTQRGVWRSANSSSWLPVHCGLRCLRFPLFRFRWHRRPYWALPFLWPCRFCGGVESLWQGLSLRAGSRTGCGDSAAIPPMMRILMHDCLHASLSAGCRTSRRVGSRPLSGRSRASFL